LSGPKSYGYRVDTAALERAREQRALLDSIARLQARHAELCIEAERAREAYGNEVSLITADARLKMTQASLDQIRAAERELSQQVAREQTQLRQQTTLITRSLAASVSLPHAQAVEDIAGVLGSHRQAAMPQTPEVARSDVSRVLARLDCRSPEDLETVRRAVATALSAEGSRAALALESLRVAVTAANEREATRVRTRARLEQLEAELDGLDPSICLTARAALSSAHNSDLGAQALDDLAGVVERTAAAARETEERRYVASQLERAFAGLGYDVSSGFATAIVDSGYVDIVKGEDAWAGYAVRVRLPSDGERVGFNVVRGEAWRPDQAAHDAEMESAFCEEVPKIQQSLAGIELQARRLAAPGEVPLQIVDLLTPNSRRHASHEQEHQL
jgi:hypothetical protein